MGASGSSVRLHTLETWSFVVSKVDTFLKCLRDRVVGFFTDVLGSLMKSFCVIAMDNSGRKNVITMGEGGFAGCGK